MRRTLLATAAAAIVPVGAADAAPATFRFHLPAGPLEAAVITIGSTAGVTIGLTDPTLAALPLRRLDGRFDAARALRRLLSGTPAMMVQDDAEAFHIVRRPHAAGATLAPRSESPRADAIVVTGSKRASTLQDYPGSVEVLDMSMLRPDRLGQGSAALVDRLPILASTHLGPGRDKLFIRGIADSSFTGPTQATVGQYLGDVRLNYNAPDPDLALYDVRTVEVLEGPQGTLYGAGSLGGIIRLEPAAPDLSRRALLLSAGGTLTAHGASGGDAAAIGNLPLVPGTLALRAVAYVGVDAGYIDDAGRGLADVNRTVTRGGRVTLRWHPRSDWTVDLGGVAQGINSRDGQYAERGLPPLTRASAFAQPFDNDYALVDLVVRHEMGGTALVSASSFVSHRLETVYDASGAAASPRRFESKDAITILTNETRLSHQGSGGRAWVIGVQMLRSEDRQTRELGPADALSAISGTRNVVEEVAAFGEATIPLLPHVRLTGGGRIDYTHQTGAVVDRPASGGELDRHAAAVLPSLALAWTAAPRLSLYARYQEGYRPGGLSVQADAAQRFSPDSLASWEAGARLGTGADRLSGLLAISYAHWEDIQADLVDAAGLPYTANIGTGRVIGVEFRAAWRPVERVRLAAALFANRSRLVRPAPAFAGQRDASLPDIPALVARGDLAYRMTIGGHAIDLTGSLRYVGRSRLGVGPLLDLPQGPYLDSAAGGSIRLGRVTLSLDATNLLDRRGNVFALGNPFGVMAGRQVTPLRPRTLRLGLATRF